MSRIAEIAEPAAVRLVATAYITEPALAPLCDSDAERAILEELEALSSARRAPAAIPIGVDRRELLTEAAGYGWTYVNAAFCYTRPTGNRFNGAERGAWYATIGATALETAEAEVAFHLTRELDNTGIHDNLTAYRAVLAGFLGPFRDLRDETGLACLDADPAVAYPAGQALARSIFADGGNGIVYPSARRQGGQCLVAFRPHLVQNIRLGATLTFEWAGSREPEIRVG